MNFLYEAQRVDAARKVQRWWDRTKHFHLNRRKRKGCITLQKYFRTRVYQLHFDAIQEKVFILEKYFHSHAYASLHEFYTKFKTEVMDDIMDSIWDCATKIKTSILETYLTAMKLRIK